ncbi:MAG: class I mannose-6-phosphate isomerase [Planctomycetales bacterium]|nr:class I mannose-6-phosphate isomerase [Planctomycetales bacterium]NIM07608.1 class I mannose-6-phosphate isomerase [Planctomycetales bacterium]NIN07114.1 class I mannose-6-phosphate isomerase [Planctomycetales bacterium]NIN76208.1 class I mannose-6-phosphate isomerase [Planctomycetales bacterium]NIO33430.1 class I mannose-6-phosphate isomerase [Planctomycetales bacterium]
MAELYPLRFRPIFRRYLWGGRRLHTVLAKSIGDGDDYAESWEVVDHGEDQSIVAVGPLGGKTLQELVRYRGAELFGRHHPQPSFPLLWKFLDANQTLSVQVHPNDRQAAQLDPPDLGKTEAWVVLDAAPGSLIYAGLKRGFDRPVVEREVMRGTVELCLHRFQPAVGDCVFLPAGTVHALGAGLLVAEIQQASDTTYRLFDWNRVGADGRPRALHVQQGLEVIDYGRGPVQPQTPQATDQPHIQRLVECDKFVLDRWQLSGSQPAGGDHRCHILAVLEGAVYVDGDAAKEPLGRGQTILLPAAAGEVRLESRQQVTLLDAYLP